MNPDLFLLIAICIFAILFMLGIERNYFLGHIKCRRCGHIGKGTLRFNFFRGGIYTVCKKCHSEDWKFNEKN